MSAILTPTGRSKIDSREPFKAGDGQPWLIGYRTKGGGYILAADGTQTDSGTPSDLLYILPGGAIVVIKPSVSPELVAEVIDCTGGVQIH